VVIFFLVGDFYMDMWLDLLVNFLGQIPRFFLSPMFYIIVIVLMLQYRREVILQRRLFNMRITSVVGELFRALSRGLLGGLVITLFLFLLGVSFTSMEVLFLQGITLLLGLIHIRYFHMGIGAGALLILSYFASILPSSGIEWISLVQKNLAEIHPYPLALLAGAMFIMEGMWLGRGKREGFFPVMIDGKRGSTVAVYQIRRFSFYPLILLTGTGSGFLPLPGIAGYVDVAKSLWPEEKISHAQKGYWLIGLTVFGMAWLLPKFEVLMLVTGLWIVIVNEGIRWTGRWLEKGKSPLFGRVPNGVRVLEVLPNSPAAKMNIEPGDIILKVNGVAVSHQNQIYPLLQRQSSFCKMEVLNKDGNIKYLHRSMYEGEHHGLGLVPVPDQLSRQYVKDGFLSLFALFTPRIHYLTERPINQDSGQGKDVSL